MLNRLKVGFIIVFLIGLFFVLAVSLLGQELLPVRSINLQGANLGSQLLQPQWTLLKKIEEARAMLAGSPSLATVEIKNRLVRKQIELAILDIETGEIFLRRYWLEDKDINQAASLIRSYLPNPNNLPRFEPADPNEEFEIINNRWNSWVSDWSVERVGVSRSDIYIVIADKYSLPNSYIVYPEDKTGPKYSDIIFSPNSDAIHDPEFVGIGRNYLNENVDAVFEELKDLGVMSRAEPGKLVVDTVSKKFVKDILINEQTDPKAMLVFAQTDDQKRRVAEKVLLRYGLNKEKAYRYTKSDADAWGPAQIVASTYSNKRSGDGVFQLYPGAKLIPDPRLGSVDMRNAIKAEILVFDDKMTQVKNSVYNSGSRAIRVFENLTEQQRNEVRAMGYNGGAGKYNLSTGSLRTGVRGYNETKQFIEKYRIISSLDLFE